MSGERIKILHTADWQIGKPYARIEDEDKRAKARQARIDGIDRLVSLSEEKAVDLVVVAGDLFDSTTVLQSIVSNTCARLGKFKVPVVVIPGNHDHGGEGSIWYQPFFKRELANLAPNVQIVLEPEKPIVLAGVTLFPCPLMRKAEPSDTTAWLRSEEVWEGAAPGTPRVILAHGATQQFGAVDLEDEEAYGNNFLDLARLPEALYDYVALGDWHGRKQVGSKAWYSGTHEPDRFPRGDDYLAGNALIVELERGAMPRVEVVKTAWLDWMALAHAFHTDADVERFASEMDLHIGRAVDRHLLDLTLTGTLGFEAQAALDGRLEELAARLIRLKVRRDIQTLPTEEELEALTRRGGDPVSAAVAVRLRAEAASDGAAGELAREALRELYSRIQLAGRG